MIAAGTQAAWLGGYAGALGALPLLVALALVIWRHRVGPLGQRRVRVDPQAGATQDAYHVDSPSEHLDAILCRTCTDRVMSEAERVGVELRVEALDVPAVDEGLGTDLECEACGSTIVRGSI